MNRKNGLFFWACNGEYFGHALQIVTNHLDAPFSSLTDDVVLLPSGAPSHGFRPVFSLRNSSVEVNFGDGPTPLIFIHKVRIPVDF